MTEWAWVALAHGVTYVSLLAFALSIAARIRSTRRRLEDLQ